MRNLGPLDARIMSTNNALDKASALVKTIDMLTTCSRSLDTVGRLIKLQKDPSTLPATNGPGQASPLQDIDPDLEQFKDIQ